MTQAVTLKASLTQNGSPQVLQNGSNLTHEVYDSDYRATAMLSEGRLGALQSIFVILLGWLFGQSLLHYKTDDGLTIGRFVVPIHKGVEMAEKSASTWQCTVQKVASTFLFYNAVTFRTTIQS